VGGGGCARDHPRGNRAANAPGNVGLLNVACVAALRLFDVETNDAKTFSFILLGAQASPLLLGGAIAHALTGSNIGRNPRPRQTRRPLESPKPYAIINEC